jgi:hypothetical protein
MAVLLAAGTAFAQDQATLVLRSGERVSGQLVDLGGVGFSIRVNGEVRRIKKAEVARIEFAGGGSLSPEWNEKLSSGQHVVQLRSGETIAGNLYDISGTQPLKVTVDTPSGRRDFNSTDIARIYLNSDSAVATGGRGTTQQPSVPGAIVVSGNQQWVPTGRTVRNGETIRFESTGEVQLSANANDKAQPAGAFSQRRPAAGAPLPDVLAGALIARIGNGEPFPIGNQTSVRMPDSGPLYLGINDDAVGDNSGQYNVVITRPRR